jgi:glucose-6-phosphate isomerase
MFADLKDKYTAVRGRQIISLFDDQRATEFSVQADGLFFDYSKTNIDNETRDMLLALVEKVDFPRKRAAMFSGEKINITEDRAVLHTALRRTSGPLMVAGCDVMEQVLSTRARMLEFAEAVRSGELKGQGGAYTDVVNIGIGGSDLGPAMACLALKPYAGGPRCHFVSNVDGAHVTDVLESLDPRTTLVIVASKTFTTIETLTNAQTALRWMAEAVEAAGRSICGSEHRTG